MDDRGEGAGATAVVSGGHFNGVAEKVHPFPVGPQVLSIPTPDGTDPEC